MYGSYIADAHDPQPSTQTTESVALTIVCLKIMVIALSKNKDSQRLEMVSHERTPSS
jgi:hypothetical protein